MKHIIFFAFIFISSSVFGKAVENLPRKQQVNIVRALHRHLLPNVYILDLMIKNITSLEEDYCNYGIEKCYENDKFVQDRIDSIWRLVGEVHNTQFLRYREIRDFSTMKNELEVSKKLLAEAERFLFERKSQVGSLISQTLAIDIMDYADGLIDLEDGDLFGFVLEPSVFSRGDGCESFIIYSYEKYPYNGGVDGFEKANVLESCD